MTVFAALTVSMSSASARPAVVSGRTAIARTWNVEPSGPGHGRGSGVRDGDERASRWGGGTDRRRGRRSAPGGALRFPAGSHADQAGAGAGLPRPTSTSSAPTPRARRRSRAGRRRLRSGCGRRGGAHGRRASRAERRLRAPAAFPATGFGVGGRLAHHIVGHELSSDRSTSGIVIFDSSSRLRSFVAEELAPCVEHVGDVLDGIAVGEDEVVGGDVRLADELADDRALVAVRRGPESIGFSENGPPPPVRLTICRPIFSKRFRMRSRASSSALVLARRDRERLRAPSPTRRPCARPARSRS